MKAVSKYSLIARLSEPFTEAAAVHTPLQARCALSAAQLRKNGSQASVSLSSFQPGITFQLTGFRLLAQVISGIAGVGLGAGVVIGGEVGPGLTGPGGIGAGVAGLGLIGLGLIGLGLTGLALGGVGLGGVGVIGLGLPGLGLTGTGLLGTLAHAVMAKTAA